MTVPTEPIGSTPKPRRLISAIAAAQDGDFTEGRLAVKIDSTGSLLHSFIDLNNRALSRFSAEDRRRIGVHRGPGSDRSSRHSGAVDYEFAPFCDDTSTTRETAFAKIRARVFGTALAAEALSRN